MTTETTVSETNAKTVEAVMDALTSIDACDDLGRPLTGLYLRAAAKDLIRELSAAGVRVAGTETTA